jgi:universal stress protein A
MFQPRTILCPTDFSENAAYAQSVALDLARQNQATLVILHVAGTLGPEKLSFGEVASALQPEAHVRRLEEQLRRTVPADAGVPVRCLLREGDPARAIEQVVHSEQCDLIVAGTHGRTGLGHLLMGSVAERIVRLSPCPVLVLKYTRPA